VIERDEHRPVAPAFEYPHATFEIREIGGTG
jgi:hypothetical protein